LTVFSSQSTTGLFRPVSTHGILPLQSFSLARSRGAFRHPLPSCRYAGCRSNQRRLQGLHPRESPLDLLGVFTERNPDALLGLQPPSGHSPFSPWHRLRGASSPRPSPHSVQARLEVRLSFTSASSWRRRTTDTLKTLGAPQSLNEQEGRLASLECCRPSWGFWPLDTATRAV
jgi:hypothetical protein